MSGTPGGITTDGVQVAVGQEVGVTARVLLDRAVLAVGHLADPEPPWAEILESGRQLVGADSATFMTFDGKGALTLHQDHVDPSAEHDYVEHFHVMDIGLSTAMTCPSGTWINTHDLIPSRVMEKTQYYADFMCRHRMRQIVCYIVKIDPVHRACFSFQREIIDPQARDQLESPVIVEFTRAVEAGLALRRELTIHRLATTEDALWLYGETTCLVSSGGLLCHASRHALDMFEGASSVRIRCGRLWHRNERVREAIYAAVGEASCSERLITIVIPDGMNGTLTLDMKRADVWMRLGNEPLVFARIKRSGVGEKISHKVMHAVFNLSNAEGCVLDHLVAGLDAGEIASTLAISLNTVRKNIALLMEKTGAKRQSDLVRIALQR